MKALQIEALKRCAFHDVPDPVPDPGEVLLEVRHIGLCGSDLATLTGLNPQLSLPSLFKTQDISQAPTFLQWGMHSSHHRPARRAER